MIFIKKNRIHLIPSIFIIFLIFIAYSNLINSFFQQDEWMYFAGDIFYKSKGIAGFIESFLPIDALSHVNPLGMVYRWILYFLFGTNFAPYAWLSIIHHVINALLLYYFVFIWLRSRAIALVAALFFGINSISHQAITWVEAANSYEIPLTFILLSLLFFHRFVANKTNWRQYLSLSLIALFVSLLFHENGMFLFLFYPVIYFHISDAERKKKLSFLLRALVICAFAFFLVRAPFFLGLKTSLPVRTDISHPPISVYPYRIFSIGLKSFSGSLVPERTLIGIAERIVQITYPQFITKDNTPNPFIAQSIVYDLVSYVLAIIIICFLLFIKRFMHGNKISDAFAWSLLYVPTSFIPYVFVLGRAGYASIADPKFFYVGSIGVSILISITIHSLSKRFSDKKLLQYAIFFVFGILVLFHVYTLRTYIHNLAETGTLRKSFLNNITSTYKILPQRVIFYVQSDTAYYGMADSEKILPVQVGFGKMLMIWYQNAEHFPGCLYKGQFLLGLLEEGYHYCDGRGFGFTRKYESLSKITRENNLGPMNVIAYSWNGNSKQFKDVTTEIRMKLNGEL